jgi:hypothetical protein
MKFVVGKPPTQKEFLLNMEQKRKSAQFSGDMEGLLSPNIRYDQEEAFEWLFRKIVQIL